MTVRTALGSVATSCPATRTVPPSALVNVVSTFTVVVLPAPFGPSREKTVPAGTSRSMPPSTILSPYVFRSPETAIAEVLMRPLSAPGLSRPCHAPVMTTDTVFYLVAPGQGTAQRTYACLIDRTPPFTALPKPAYHILRFA